MDWYEPEVRELEARRRGGTWRPGGVVFYGSSSIRLWESLEVDFPGLPVTNAGFGGSTLAACSWFFFRLIPPLRPAAMVFYAGDNDLGDGKTAADVFAQLGHLLDQIDAHLPELHFAFLSVKPSPSRWHLVSRIRELNALAEARLEARARSCYVDVFNPMLDPEGRPRRELFLDDELHLSAPGYALWRRVLLDARQRAFPKTFHEVLERVTRTGSPIPDVSR